MSFIRAPVVSQDILEWAGGTDELYQAVGARDMTGAVMTALNTIRYTDAELEMMAVRKNAFQSTIYCEEGNDFENAQSFQEALICYNKALLYAPGGSLELTEAYYNRSALLLKVSAFSACLADIQTCLLLRCPDALKLNLNKIKERCVAQLLNEKTKTDNIIRGFPVDFFKFNVRRHPSIPCLSADIDVVAESRENKAVAAKDIHVGTLLAVEKAFMTHSGKDMAYWSCYYCQSVTFNLMPCENCCFVLFCSEKCKSLCLTEYHSVECEIMEYLEAINLGQNYKFGLIVKTVLKLKMLCNQWSNLITETENIGASRLATSSLNEIYDFNNFSSILSFIKRRRHFVFGSIYNASYKYAALIYFLGKIPDFFPEMPDECYEAKRCLANLFMTLELYWPHFTEIENAGEELREIKMNHPVPHHFGLFSFTSKLKHSCDPNVILLGLNNRVGLLAVRPIKKNMEITISYVGHWYEHLHKKARPMRIYTATFGLCSCLICKESWDSHKFIKSNLSEEQQQAYRAWDQYRVDQQFPQREPSHFRETCRLLEWLEVNTKEHREVFTALRSQLSLCQHAAILRPYVFSA